VRGSIEGSALLEQLRMRCSFTEKLILKRLSRTQHPGHERSAPDTSAREGTDAGDRGQHDRITAPAASRLLAQASARR